MSSDSMRVYVHSVPNAAFPAWVAPHTFVFVCGVGEASPSVRKLKQSYKEDLFKHHFSKDVIKLPIMSQGVIRNAAGTELTDEVLVAAAVDDRDDLFFELKGTQPVVAAPKTTTAASTTTTTSSSSSSSSSAGPTIQIQSGNGAPITVNRADLQSMGPQAQIMFHSLSQAREMQSKGQLKKAREVYLGVLKQLPSEKAALATATETQLSCKQICHQQLGVIYLYNRFYDQARPHFEQAIKIIMGSTSGPNADIVKAIGKTPQLELAQLTCLAGQCWFGLGDYVEAQPCFERALKLLTPKGEESKDPKVVEAIQDTKVWLARAMYRGGTPAERSQALSMFESLIAQNEHHIAALTYYAQIAIECGKKGEVLPYLLRALVASQAAGPQPPKGAASYEVKMHMKDKKKPENAIEIDPQLLELVQTLLTDLVSAPGGVKTLFTELHQAASNHSALTFLAQTVKDQGGVVASIEIYRRALQVCDLPPRPRAHLLLNLVHTMELEYQYQEAYDLIKTFCKDHPDLTVGTLKLGTFYEAIQNVNNVYDPALRSCTAAGVPAFCEIGRIFDEGTIHITLPSSEPPKKSTAVQYPADELNMMALMFTAVKMLYICGGLQVIPTLVNQLEPLRVDRDLHLTQIRNEHAYYSSIAQMMRSIQPIPADLANPRPEDTIYVCGDSHSMSAAWQVIRLDAHPRPLLLQPKLVTGLKCWHLRPSCRFYPKRNFEAAMRSTPNGATVIFNFGEIDCREGLIVATEKGRYESIDEGIKLAVDVYIKALQAEQAKKNLRIYVHPITPVLDVTRNTVKAFNALMRQKTEATFKPTAQPTKQPSPALVYLDFFEQLLTPDGNGFNMEFHLDSTHLKPTYVHRLLAPALNLVYPHGTKRAPAQVQPAPLSTMDAINAAMKAAAAGDIGGDEEDVKMVSSTDQMD